MITGCSGFVGVHLAKELSTNGYEVVGVDRSGFIDHNKYLNEHWNIDLTDANQINKLDLRGLHAVVHLAGLAAVGPSFDEPLKYLTTNAGIEINLLEALRKQNATPKIVIVSSSAVYSARNTWPTNEDSLVFPNSPYSISKLTQELVGKYYQLMGLEIVTARPFNHIGPGQNLGFIVPDVAKQVVDIERGNGDTILVGNLSAKRDYTDVRDIVRAYRLLIERGIPGETYNICSGIPVSGEEIVDKISSLSEKKIRHDVDQKKSRPSDNPIIYGSYGKIKKDTGWGPEISLDKTLLDVLADWRNR